MHLNFLTLSCFSPRSITWVDTLMWTRLVCLTSVTLARRLATTIARGPTLLKDTAAPPTKHVHEPLTVVKTPTSLWGKSTSISVLMRSAVPSPKWSSHLLTELSSYLNIWQANLSAVISVHFKFQCPPTLIPTMSFLSGLSIFNTLQPPCWKEPLFGISCLDTPP